MCVCRPCYLLFTRDGAAAGKYQGRAGTLSQSARAGADPTPNGISLQIPVGIAFFFFNSSLGRTVVFYPGPAGATESLLALETWA